MARGKRVCGPRRVPLLALGTAAGAVGDDAIDLDASDITEFMTSLFDVSHLAMKPGEKPSWFTINPMSTAQIRNEPEGSEIEVASYRVLCGLSKIENFVNVADDGEETPAVQPDRKARGMGQMATENWLNTSGLSSGDILGLGWMIKHVSEPQRPFFKPSDKPSGPSDKSET